MSAIVESFRRIAGTGGREYVPSVVVGLGHGATHWISATLYVLLPFIGKDLGLSYTEIGGLVSLLYAASFMTNIGAGPLVDLTGRYVLVQAAALMIGGIALATLGLAAAGLWLAVLIFVIGISISLWHPAAITFLARRYPATRGFAMSLHNLGASFGDTMAPIIAGSLLTFLAWRETALLSAIPMFVMMALVLLVLREPEARGGATPRPKPRRDSYLEGLKLLVRDRAMLQLLAMAGIRSMTQNGILVFLPLYLVGVMKAGPALVGTAIMTMQIGGTFAGPLAGLWSDRVGRRPVALAGLGTSTVLIAALTLVEPIGALIALVGVIGFAIFSVRPVVHSWTMDLARDETSGSAVSLLFMAQTGMTTLVPVIGGIIADAWGLQTVFYILTLTCLLAATVVFFMPNSRPPILEASGQ